MTQISRRGILALGSAAAFMPTARAEAGKRFVTAAMPITTGSWCGSIRTWCSTSAASAHD